MDITNAMQNCTLTPQKGGEHNNDRKENGTQSLCQENKNKYVSGIKDAQTQKPEVPKGESRKDLPHSSCDRVKEYNSANRDSPRVNRNGLNPRFKKNSDSTCRRCFKINFSDFRLIALRTVFLQIGIVHSILRNCIIRIRIGDRIPNLQSRKRQKTTMGTINVHTRYLKHPHFLQTQ